VRPFRAVALGLLVVVLTVVAARVDVLADPLGWVLVLVGVRALPPGYPLRLTVTAAVGLALLISVPLVLPPAREAIAAGPDAVGWGFSLPTLLALGLLTHAIGSAAGRAGDRGRATLYRAVEVGFVVVAVLPVMVIGAGADVLAAPAALLVVLVPIVLLLALFFDADRAWAGAPRPASG